MLVYRIEHKDTASGPYQGDIEFNDPRQYDMGCAHTNDDHPSMWFDCDYISDRKTDDYKSHDYYCGFSRLRDLKSWFDGWLDILSINGYIIVKYAVPAKYVIKGSKQIVFVKDQAIKVD